jgi:hypothetical protein
MHANSARSIIVEPGGDQVAGNKSTTAGGGAQGGGILSTGTKAFLNSSPVTDNEAISPDGGAEGGGIYWSELGSVTLFNSAVSRNLPHNCFPLDGIPNCRD